MYRTAEQRLTRWVNAGQESLLTAGRVGLEKETLRVNPEGCIAQSDHPPIFGSALANPWITTDYSEALLELITPPLDGISEALTFLGDVQQFVYRHLPGGERLWATSMPCVLKGEASIPIARYGSSNLGLMKNIYRRGLGYRYGKMMQVIAGVHFNYSFSDTFWETYREQEGDKRALTQFVNDHYFGLLRNLQRFGWLVPYLFGASPAVCKSFVAGQHATLQPFDDGTLFEPYATSLRMGDIGYQNNQENEFGIKACYDNLDAYVKSLRCAVETPCPEYEKIGVKVDGEYRQLSANILQIENEYYSTVRPKQPLQNNEQPSLALKRRGVAYVELRSLDVNAFHPLGIEEGQLRFLEAFIIFCLLHSSPPINSREQAEIDENEMATAHRGRQPGLILMRNGREQTLKAWALELCDAMDPVCDVLDRGRPQRPYRAALQRQREAVLDPERTPSARMLAEMRANGEGFFAFARRKSLEHEAWSAGQPISEARFALFRQSAEESLARQRAIEAADTLGFDAYLAAYFAQS